MTTPETRFELRTSRLRLVPLTLEDLRLDLARPAELARRLGVLPALGERPGELAAIFAAEERRLALETATDPQAYLWHVWSILSVEEQRPAGGLLFKGRPTAAGEVELGYGLDQPYRGRGYMTEAVSAVAAWALDQRHVLAILAETDPDNITSHRVLIKSGFSRFRETDDMLWWRRLRGAPPVSAQ